MKKFFIVTDIDGNIISGGLEFVDEREAKDWVTSQGLKDRAFIECVTEVM